MAITEIKSYVCSDGTKYYSRQVAEAHEQKLEDAKFSLAHSGLSDAAARWLRTSYSGKQLLQLHSLDEEGVWMIFGEDPNCDMGGQHHQPNLGTVHGKLRNVVNHAVSLANFYSWGSGGDIRKTEVKKV